jgi:uncharacterized tellurite resistance protein B-like protein
MAVDKNLLAVADILLGAAYADGTGDGTEILAVRDLLREIVGAALPEDLEKRVASFSPKTFDLAASAKAFLDGPKITPRRLVELVASIRDADEEIDFAEDEYLRSVGKAVGLKESEYADLAVDFEIDEVRAAFNSKAPPPPPKK